MTRCSLASWSSSAPTPFTPTTWPPRWGSESHGSATALTTLQLRGAITEVCGGRVARTF